MTRRGWLRTVVGGLVGACLPWRQVQAPVQAVALSSLGCAAPGMILRVSDNAVYTFGFSGFVPGEDPMHGKPGRLVAFIVAPTWGKDARP